MSDRPTHLRVLLLEENPRNAEQVVRELRRAHFDPDWKRVATEQDYLAQLDPGLDVILSDYSLTGLPGLRALRLLREQVGAPARVLRARIGVSLDHLL